MSRQEDNNFTFLTDSSVTLMSGFVYNVLISFKMISLINDNKICQNLCSRESQFSEAWVILAEWTNKVMFNVGRNVSVIFPTKVTMFCLVS